MTVTQTNYEQYFKRGLAEGFDVIGAEQHYDTAAGMTAKLEQLIYTPWTFNGIPVYCYSKTDVSSRGERENGYRRIETHEFWIYDNQGTPVSLEKAYPGGYDLTDRQGSRLSAGEAFSIIDDFIIAASYHPHVFLASEYAEARNYLNGRMGLAEVTPDDYKEYLEHIEGQMRNNQFIFTGRIKNLKDMDIAYESLKEMEIYSKKRRIKFPKLF